MTKIIGDYFIDVAVEEYKTSANVKVWIITGWGIDEEDKPTEPLFGENCSLSFEDRGEPDYHGFCKWDGCLHFNFDDVYQHWCGPEDVVKMAAMLAEVYAMAKGAMEEAGAHVDY